MSHRFACLPLTVTDLELRHGLQMFPAESCVWLDREIENLSDHTSDLKAQDYMDIRSPDKTPDSDLGTKLKILRQKMESKVKQNLGPHLEKYLCLFWVV